MPETVLPGTDNPSAEAAAPAAGVVRPILGLIRSAAADPGF